MGLTKYLAGDLDFYGIITKSKAPCIYNRMFSWVLDPFFKNFFIILSLYRYRLKIHQTMGVSVSSFDCCGTCCLCSYNKIWLLKPHLSSQWQSLICVTVTRDKDVWLNHLPSSSICRVLNSCRHLKPDSFFILLTHFSLQQRILNYSVLCCLSMGGVQLCVVEFVVSQSFICSALHDSQVCRGQELWFLSDL